MNAAKFSRTSRNTFIFYAGFIVIMLGMYALMLHINSLPFATEPPAEASAAAALSKAEDSYSAVNNLLTTLGTGLLAALGWFITARPNQTLAKRAIWPAAASAICVSISLFWGYVSSQNVEGAIEYNVGSLDIPWLQIPRQLQALAILIGVFFFADFVRRDLTMADSPTKTQPHKVAN